MLWGTGGIPGDGSARWEVQRDGQQEKNSNVIGRCGQGIVLNRLTGLPGNTPRMGPLLRKAPAKVVIRRQRKAIKETRNARRNVKQVQDYGKK